MTSSLSRGHAAKGGAAKVLCGRCAAAWVLICCCVVSVLSAQQAAQGHDVLASVIPVLKSQTSVPILLPNRLPALAEETYYAHSKGDADGYMIRIESDPDCDGANACFLGILRAKRGERFSFPQVVKLTETITARYKPTTCGGSCSEQAIEWKYKGVLYTAQLNLKTESEKEARAQMIELANSAVRGWSSHKRGTSIDKLLYY
jgi:hypothetical protein